MNLPSKIKVLAGDLFFADTFKEKLEGYRNSGTYYPSTLVKRIFYMIKLFYELDLATEIPEENLPTRFIEIGTSKSEENTIEVYMDKGWTLKFTVLCDCMIQTLVTIEIIGMPIDFIKEEDLEEDETTGHTYRY